MLKLYKQEVFKIIKSYSTYWLITALLLQNFLFAVISHLYPEHFIPKELFVSNYATTSFIALIMIATTASIVSSEFEYNTLKNIIVESTSRQQIIISKWLTILTYSLVLYLLISCETLLNKLLFFHHSFYLSEPLHGSSVLLWQYWLETLFTNFVNLWLLLSLVFLIASLLKKSSTAIIFGLVGYFALSITGRLMFQLIKKWEFLKWNPINFLNYPFQLAEPTAIAALTKLTDFQLFIGNIAYIFLFLSIGLVLFSKKEA